MSMHYSSESMETSNRTGFYIRDDFGPGTYYFKVTTPAGVTSHPVPYTIHAFEDTEYTEYIEGCEARTRSLNNPQISDPLYSCQWHLNSPEGVDANVEAAWAQGVTGEGVNVAVVDDGMYFTHVDLRDNVDASRNHDYTGRAPYIPPWSTTAPTLPASSPHGTTVSACAVWPQGQRYTATTTWQARPRSFIERTPWPATVLQRLSPTTVGGQRPVLDWTRSARSGNRR